MSEEDFRRAIRMCITNAHLAGHTSRNGGASLQEQLIYAETVLVPLAAALGQAQGTKPVRVMQ